MAQIEKNQDYNFMLFFSELDFRSGSFHVSRRRHDSRLRPHGHHQQLSRQLGLKPGSPLQRPRSPREPSRFRLLQVRILLVHVVVFLALDVIKLKMYFTVLIFIAIYISDPPSRFRLLQVRILLVLDVVEANVF